MKTIARLLPLALGLMVETASAQCSTWPWLWLNSASAQSRNHTSDSLREAQRAAHRAANPSRHFRSSYHFVGVMGGIRQQERTGQQFDLQGHSLTLSEATMPAQFGLFYQGDLAGKGWIQRAEMGFTTSRNIGLDLSYGLGYRWERKGLGISLVAPIGWSMNSSRLKTIDVSPEQPLVVGGKVFVNDRPCDCGGSNRDREDVTVTLRDFSWFVKPGITLDYGVSSRTKVFIQMAWWLPLHSWSRVQYWGQGYDTWDNYQRGRHLTSVSHSQTLSQAGLNRAGQPQTNSPFSYQGLQASVGIAWQVSR